MNKIKGMLKDTFIIFAITLIAGLLLGVVYEVTKEPIATQKALRKTKACQEVFTDAASFEVVDGAAQEDDVADINELSKALAADGTLLGYVVDVTTHGGYNGDIQFTMGVRLDGTINGISLLAISETPGLGMQAEEVLKPQFAGKQISQFILVKGGAVVEDEIDAISGATITSTALVNGVNKGLACILSNSDSMEAGGEGK